MLELQLILVVSTHAEKGVYPYINVQRKSPIAWASSTWIPKRKGTTCICTEHSNSKCKTNPYHQKSPKPSQIKIISKCNRIWNGLSGRKFWLLLFFYFWLTIKCFAKDSSGNIWKHKNPQWREGKPWSLCVGQMGAMREAANPDTVGGSWSLGDTDPSFRLLNSGFSPSVLEILCKYQRCKMLAVSHSLAREGFWASCLLCFLKANAWLHLLFLHIHSWKIYLEGKI